MFYMLDYIYILDTSVLTLNVLQRKANCLSEGIPHFTGHFTATSSVLLSFLPLTTAVYIYVVYL